MKLIKGIERWGRKRAAVLLRGSMVDEGSPLPEDPSRILVIRTDSRLGNLVLMEPLLRSLSLRFPDAEMDILASDTFSELLETQGYSVIRVDKKGQIRDPGRFFRLIAELRERDYDVALDAAHPHSFSLSGAAAAFLSGAGHTVSTDAGESSGWYSRTVPEPPMHWHESRSLHSLGSLWEDWPEWSPPALDAKDVEMRDAVGIHVGASGNKEYPMDKLRELIEKLCRNTMLEIYWGGQNERQRAECLGSGLPVAVMPGLTVTSLIMKIAGLRHFITPDNGPMHLASALSVPVTALFRVDNVERFRPLSQGSRVFLDSEGPAAGSVAEHVLRSLGCY